MIILGDVKIKGSPFSYFGFPLKNSILPRINEKKDLCHQ